MSEYPTDEELEYIQNFESLDFEITKDFLKFIKDIWQYGDVGYYKLTGKNVLKLELHTGGWSGNESIIYALKQTKLFWMMCWRKSVYGGHYYFEIKKSWYKGE